MALSNDTKRRLTVATASANAGNELSGALDGLIDRTLNVVSDSVTIYVETTGNDTNPGTQDKPMKTIQAAIDSLNGLMLLAPVTIQVGAGQFDGFVISDTFSVGGSGNLTVQGTLTQTAELTATGTGSINGEFICNTTDLTTIPNGTFVGCSSLNQNPYCNVFDHSGTDTIRTTMNSLVAVGRAVQFYDLATEILCTAVDPLWGSNTSICVNRSDVWRILCPINISYLKTTVSGSNKRPVILNSGVQATGLQVELGTSTMASYFGNGVYVLGGLWTITSGAASRSCVTGSTRQNSNIQLTNMTFVGTGATASSAINFGQAATDFKWNTSLCTFRDFTTAINLTTSQSYSAVMYLGGHSFTGCTTAIGLSGKMKHIIAYGTNSFFSPTNTTFLSLARGSTAEVGSTLVANATTELSVDGATSTLAAMRALSPKAFPATPNVYGSVAYE